MIKSLSRFTFVILLLFLLCVVFSCRQTKEEGITEQDAKIFADHVLEIWNEGNLDRIDEVYAPEIIVRASTFPEDIVGLEGLKNWVDSTHMGFSDFNMTFEEIIVKGDKIITRWTSSGIHTGVLSMPLGELPPTNKKIHISGIAINRMENGKAVEEIVVYNVLELMQQLGFALVPPSF